MSNTLAVLVLGSVGIAWGPAELEPRAAPADSAADAGSTAGAGMPGRTAAAPCTDRDEGVYLFPEDLSGRLMPIACSAERTGIERLLVRL